MNPQTPPASLRPASRLAARCLGLAAVALTAGLLAACGGSDDDNFDDRAGTADPKVRFVHAVPGGPNVTLQRNGSNETAVDNVAYKFGSQYYNVGTSSQVLTLRTTVGATALATTTLDARRGNRYSFLAVPDAGASSGVSLLRIDDPYNKSLASDDARVRVVNGAPNAAAFDVYITPRGASLTGLTPQLAGLGYQQVAPASGTDSIDLEGGNYQLRFTLAGTKTSVFDADIALPANADWLLIALPEDATPLVPNSVRVLLVRADDSADATDEIVTR